MAKKAQISKPLWQIIDINIFVASGFSADESDLYRSGLMKYVLPELSEWCRKWQLFLNDRYFAYPGFDLEIIKAVAGEDPSPHSIFLFLLKGKQYRYLPEEVDALEKSITKLHKFLFFTRCDANWQQAVERDIKEWISKIYQQRFESIWHKDISLWEQEDNAHEFFAMLQTRMFAHRKKATMRLENYLNNHIHKVYGVYGERGMGKTALLSHLYIKHLKRIRDHDQDKSIIIAHFVDACSQGGSLQFLLLRLCTRLKQFYQLTIDIPKDLASLVRCFKDILGKGHSETIIIIDGLERLELENYNLLWLSESLPKHVKIIVSANYSEVSNLLAEKTKQKLVIAPLTKSQTKDIVHNFMKFSWRSLFVNKFISKEILQISNPLHLHIILQILEIDPQYKLQVSERAEDFFEALLIVLENEYDNIIQPLFSLIYCSRQGLTIHELRELLLEIDSDAYYLLILRGLANYLYQYGERISIIHPTLLQVLKDRYMDNNTVQHYHNFLAEYFASVVPVVGKLSEEPYQLLVGENYEQLAKLLCDIEFLKSKIQIGKIEELRQDFKHFIEKLPRDFLCEVFSKIVVNKKIIQFLYEILEREWSFLDHYPQCVFQTFWNYGYWYDCPERQKFYKYQTKSTTRGPKLYKLVEYWRKQEEVKNPIWIKSIYPLGDNLDSDKKMLFIADSFESRVLYTTVSPDGRKIASILPWGKIKIYDICGGNYSFFENYASICRFSPNGEYLAVGTDCVYVTVWDLATRKLIHRHSHDKIVIVAVDFTHDSKQVISAGTDDIIRIHKIGSKRALRVIGVDSPLWVGPMKCAAIEPQKNLVLVAGTNRDSFELWDLSGELTHAFTTHNLIEHMQFSPNGKYFLTVDNEGRVCIWSATKKKKLFTITENDRRKEFWACFSPNGKKVAIKLEDQIDIWEAQDKQFVCVGVEQQKLAQLCFLDNDTIFYSNVSGVSYITKISNREISSFRYGHRENMVSSCISDSGKYAASMASDKTICAWKVETGEWIDQKQLNLYDNTLKPQFVPGKEIVVYNNTKNDKILGLWDVKGNELLGTILLSYNILNYEVSPNGDSIATLTNRSITVWDIDHQEKLITIEINDSYFTSNLKYSPDGQQLAIVSDGNLTVCEVFSGKKDSFSSTGIYGFYYCIRWSRDGSKIAVLESFQNYYDCKIVIFDVVSKEHFHTIFSSNSTYGYFLDMAFNDDGTEIWVSYYHECICVYNTESGKLIREIEKLANVQEIADPTKEYCVFQKDGITTVEDKKRGQSIAFFRGEIAGEITKDGTIVYHSGNYLYMLKLCGV